MLKKIMALGTIAAMAMTGCPNEVSEEKKCECSEKGHLLPCECGADNCDCAVIPYGYVDTNLPDEYNESIPVYMTKGVTNEQMATFIGNIQSLYNNDGSPELPYADKIHLSNKIKEIRAVPGAGSCEPAGDGKYIIEINYIRTPSNIWDEITYYLNEYIMTSQVRPDKSRPEKSVKLAALPKTAPYPRAAFGNGSAGTPGASFA